MLKSIIIIPSRLKATRLPHKPLLKINGKSLIIHVLEKAISSGVGDVYVASPDDEILQEVKKNNGQSIKTSDIHKTGTDRIYEAFKKLNMTSVDYVINLQGDEPLIDIQDIRNLVIRSIKINSEISTLACEIKDKNVYKDKNIVKVTTFEKLKKNNASNALDFERSFDKKKNINIYQHFGIYMYRKDILKKFVSLSQSENEKKLNLEQLRALDNNIKIDVILSPNQPIGVDTEKDYIEIKKLMEYNS